MSMKQYVVLAVLFLIAAVLAGGYAGLLAGGVVGPHLRHESLTLVDDEGNERAVLGAAAGAGEYGLTLLDRDGRKRAVLSLDETGAPHLTLADEAEVARAELFAETGDVAGLRVRSETGADRVSLGVGGAGNGQGESAVRIHDAEGAPVLLMTDAGDEGPAFSVQDGDGAGRALLGLMAGGSPALRFLDASERPRLTMGADAEHRGFVRLQDEAHIVRAELAERGEDGASLTLRDAEDTPAASLSAGGGVGGTLHIYGENGDVLASLGMNGEPSLRLHETPAGNPLIQLVSPGFEVPLAELLIDDEQHAVMEFRDHDGEVVWSAP